MSNVQIYTYPYRGQDLTPRQLHALPERHPDITLPQLAVRMSRGIDAEKAISTPPKAWSPRTLKTHNYKGLQLTSRELKSLTECLTEVTRKHLLVRLSLGWEAERAISTPLKRESSFAESVRVFTAKARERKRLKAVMSVPIRPETTSAYYTLGALEARKQLQLTQAQ